MVRRSRVYYISRNLDLLMLDVHIHVLRRGGGSVVDGTARRMVVHVLHAVVIFYFNRCRI